MEHQHQHIGHQIKALRLSWKIGGMLPCAVPGIDTVRVREQSTDRSQQEGGGRRMMAADIASIMGTDPVRVCKPKRGQNEAQRAMMMIRWQP